MKWNRSLMYSTLVPVVSLKEMRLIIQGGAMRSLGGGSDSISTATHGPAVEGDISRLVVGYLALLLGSSNSFE